MKINLNIKMSMFLLVCGFPFLGNYFAQSKTLKFQEIFTASRSMFNHLPSVHEWFNDDNYFDTSIDSTTGDEILVAVNVVTGKTEELLNYTSWKNDLPEGFNIKDNIESSKDKTKYIFEKDNDLYFLDTKESTFKQITKDGKEKHNPHFSPNGEQIAFTSGHNLYVADIENETVKQLTQDGSDVIYNGWASWVYMEEILERSSHYAAFWWSPDSKNIAYLRFDDSLVPEFPLYHQDGVHGKIEWTRYPKVGDPNPKVKLGIADIESEKTIWADLDYSKDQYIAWPFWSLDSKQLFFQVLNRDQNDLLIYSANPKTGKKKTIYEEKQATWVEFYQDLTFLKNGTGFILRSDKSGWRNLYLYDMTGKLINKITDLDWQVDEITLVDEKNGKVYFQGTGKNSTESHLFVINLDGSNLKQLTKTSGTHRTTLSPGGKYFIDKYDSYKSPAKLAIFDNEGKLIKELGDSKTTEMDGYNLGEDRMFTIPTEDGHNLPVKEFLPPNFDESKKYPVLFSVYGGPGIKTVRNSFARFFYSYYLAEQGIIYIKVDQRGSGHYGKKGMNFMYRNLGKWAMNDFITASKWARNLPFVDTTKIAITGGSYGGYVTALAMTYGADYFNYGIAQYSVTDWELYDDIYTERYMDLPKDNPDGYKFGSVMTHADNYKGLMLITHGTIDNNVHLQNTLQLVNKLENLDKDFQMMLYPGERHGIGFPKVIHSFRNNTKFWFNNLLNKKFNAEKD